MSQLPRHYTYRHRVTFDETNLVGNVYFAHYLHWQGHCREHFLADRAPSVVAALDRGLALVTVGCGVDYFAEGHALDIIEVRMMLERAAANRIVMTFDYVRMDPGPVMLLARGHQTVACMRRSTNGLVATPLPDDLRRALAAYSAQSERPAAATGVPR